jgi:DNA Polymerase alpha zinc finger
MASVVRPVQAVLAARCVMKHFYRCEYKADDEVTPYHSREIHLATRHPRLGPCAPGACPPEPQCWGPMEPVVTQATAYLQLSHIARQLDVPLAAAQIPISAEADVQPRVMAVEPMLRVAHDRVMQLVKSTAYHWVSISSLLGSLCVQD